MVNNENGNLLSFSSKKELRAWVNKKAKEKPAMNSPPFLLNGMTAAIEKIKAAIKFHREIVIFAHSDCDGIVGAAIMRQGLGAAEGVTVMFTSHKRRNRLTADDVDEIYLLHPKALIITVDTGTYAIEAVEKCKALGLEIIVTDHHKPRFVDGAELLPACTMINPKQMKCKYPNKELSGAGVALKLVQGLSGKEYADLSYLACISIISDQVSIIGENRKIVLEGLRQIQKRKLPASVIQLITEAHMIKYNTTLNFLAIDEKYLRHDIIPILNAGNKFKQFSPHGVLDCLSGKMPTDDLYRMNQARKEQTKYTLVQANKNADVRGKVGIVYDNSIDCRFLGSASSYLLKRNRIDLAVALSKLDENTIKGSIRARIDGLTIIQQCNDLLLDFGGHERAVGFIVSIENIDELIERLCGIVNSMSEHQSQRSVLHFDKSSMLDLETVSIINSLGPFGPGNEEPSVSIDLTPRVCKNFGKSHLKFLFKTPMQAIFYNGEDKYADLGYPDKFTAVGRLGFQEHKGAIMPSMTIDKIHTAA